MKEGLSYESFAGTIRMSRAVLYKWEKDHPEWLAAKEIGMDLCLLWWEKAGRAGMFKQTFKPGIWVHNMKARFRRDGWNPTVVVAGSEGEYDFAYDDE